MAVAVAVAVPLVLIAVLGSVWLLGWRLFVVGTPSMGTAAPVGSLVIDAPRGAQHPVVGEIVTYRPRSVAAAPITHRVIAVEAGGVRTRGDINAQPDPWVTPVERIIGSPVAVLPGAGWIFRAGPVLILGLLAVLLLSRFLRSTAQRTAARMLGTSVVVAGVIGWLRPLLNASVVTTGAVSGGIEAHVVSTGLLPIRVSVGDASVHLASGEVGRILLPQSGSGRYLLATALDVGPLGWTLLALACAAPVLWIVVAGPAAVPAEPDPSA